MRSLRPPRVRRCLAVALLLVALPLRAARSAPHRGLHERIAAATQRLAEEPGDARLFVRRAQLFEEHGDWPSALADVAAARALAPALAENLLVEGRILLAAGEPAAALASLDRYVALAANDPRGFGARARVRAELGDGAGAVADLTRSIGLSDPPGPEAYVARARLQAAAGPEGREQALRGLDEGLRRLGPAVSLMLAAVEIELQSGLHDAALARLDVLARSSARQERWHVERGDVLRAAGRADEAARSYRAALADVRGLDPRRRLLPAVVAIERRALAGLMELQRPPTERPPAKETPR